MTDKRTLIYRCRNYITHSCTELVWAAGHTCKKCIDAGYYPKDEGPWKGEWPPKKTKEDHTPDQGGKDSGGEPPGSGGKEKETAKIDERLQSYKE